MNDALISRQAAIDAIWDGTNYDIFTREVKEVLEALPSAQPDKVFFVKTNRLLSFEDLKSLKMNLTEQCQNIVLLPEDCSLVYPERKKGKWIRIKESCYQCNQCGVVVTSGFSNFCHRCGADMRGDEK